MTTALVTGATGFIGPHLVRALRDEEIDVTCLVRPTSDVARLEPLGVRLSRSSLTDPDALCAAAVGADVIFHLAGVTKTLQPARDFAVNEEGVRRLAEAAAAQPTPPVFVLVSSMAAVGPATGDRPRVESDPPRPVSRYGFSKAAGERAAAELAGRLPVTIVRPPIVFGQGDRDVLQMFRQVARFGMLLAPAMAPRRVSMIHAHDLSLALIAAFRRGRRVATASQSGGESDAEGVYFVAHDEHPDFRQLARDLSAAVGRKRAMVVPLPGAATWMAAAMTELLARLRRRPFIFNLDKAREATAGSWWCSPQRAHQQLDWRPRQSLPERLAETADWYRQQGWL